MRTTHRLATGLVLSALAFTVSCADETSTPNEPFRDLRLTQAAGGRTTAAMRAIGDKANIALGGRAYGVRVGAVEWITSADGGEEGGQIVFFNDRGNKELSSHFVPGDPRRDGRTNITYLVDQSGDTGDPTATGQSEAAIDRAMATWDGETCSALNITKNVDTGADPDLLDELDPAIPDDGTGGIFAADIVHAGWIPTGFPTNVIAATFTFIFVDEDGIPTDIDNNKRADVAWREIYYNDQFLWQINGNIDVETAALHESGHGLSQAHYGTLFQTTSNGQFHFAPRAVMNAGYTGIQQALTATDNGGHCTNWGSWPLR
jgi:hypothetical protein